MVAPAQICHRCHVLLWPVAPSRGQNSTSRRPFQRAPRATVPPSTRGRLTKGRRFFARVGKLSSFSSRRRSVRSRLLPFFTARPLVVFVALLTSRASSRDPMGRRREQL